MGLKPWTYKEIFFFFFLSFCLGMGMWRRMAGADDFCVYDSKACLSTAKWLSKHSKVAVF